MAATADPSATPRPVPRPEAPCPGRVGAPFRPPVPAAPEGRLPARAFLRAIRTNAIAIWPASAYRDDVTVRTFMGRTSVTVTHPAAVHHVLVGNAANYRRSPASIRILRPITGDGLLLSQGEQWKLQRRTVAPALGPRIMPMLARHVMHAVQAAVPRLAAQAGQPLDLLSAMQSLALDIAGRSMFSLEMEQHGPALRRFITEFAVHHARPHMLDMLLPPSLPAPRDWGRARFRRRWMGFVQSLIAGRLAAPPAEVPRDLFDLLRAARDPETGRGFTPAELRDQVATLILAGHETTAVTLFWALTLLAQAPSEQEWLAEEAAAAAPTPDNAGVLAGELPRTRAVLNEALRLYPPAFTIVRESLGPDRLGGIDIPRRTLIMIPPWVLHRHAAWWRDADAFIPGRFMPDQPAPAKFAFLPFGTGARVCVGAQFAMTEATLVLAALAGGFRIAMAQSRPVLPVGVVTTQPDHLAHVIMTPRSTPAPCLDATDQCARA